MKKIFFNILPYIVLGITVLVLCIVVTIQQNKLNKVVTKEIDVIIGEKLNIKEQYKNKKIDVSKLQFYSSNEDIASIDKETGILHAKQNGKVIITVKSLDDKSYLEKILVTIKEKENNWIKFDNENYICKEGEILDTMIRTSGLSSIKEFKSNNSSVAKIEDGTKDGYVTNCIDCRAVHITCQKAGVVTLSATSTTNATTTSTVTVTKNSDENDNNDWIRFDKENYVCKEGEVLDAMITTGGELSSIKEFKSSNPNIAVIEDGTKNGELTKCINCRAVHITCKSKGNTTLSATSTTNISVSIPIKVN